jgi:UDP-N-acetylglucosamine 1-carboxyvinyltransferase
MLVARAGGLHGAPILLEFPSVTGTENLVMAAVLAKGTTVLDNAAREPEVVDLCALLARMGARIDGAGTSTITIEGVEELAPTEHEIVPDRIVAGTYAYGAVMTQGEITVRRGRIEHLEVALAKLQDAGATIDPVADGFRVAMSGRPRAVDVVTLPFPGFPTDLQPLAIALAAVSDGAAIVTENLYDGRFQFVDELSRLGADVRIDGHHCIVHGRPRLSAAPVRASDVRAGAGLVLAGLVAEGVTDVHEVFHIDRGYAGFLDTLGGLGAVVERVSR